MNHNIISLFHEIKNKLKIPLRPIGHFIDATYSINKFYKNKKIIKKTKKIFESEFSWNLSKKLFRMNHLNMFIT